MISLVWSMLVARRGQLTVVLLLSVFATGAAVAGPVYLDAVDRATVVTEVAEAPRTERVVSLSATLDQGTAARFDNLTSSLLTLPGFTSVYSAQFGVLGVEEGDTSSSWLTFRADVCQHLELVSGRCAISANELVLGESTARRRALPPGSTVTVTASVYDATSRRFVPAGQPAELTVVGVYRPADPAEAYWGRSASFTPGSPDTTREPVFVTRPAIEAIDHPQDQRTVEAQPTADALTIERIPALRAELAELAGELGGGSGVDTYAGVQTELPGLLDRIDRARELARQVVPVAAVPLVALCWFVIFLAVADGTAARRQELGLLALRGVGRPYRWWLTAGESGLAILLGAPIGFVAGVVGVGLLTRVRFDGAAVAPVGAGAAWAALAAVAGALLAGLLAQRRELARSVVDLLRRVPARQARWRTAAAEATVVVLALVAAVQLRGFDGELVGLSLLAPALVALAVALVAARLLMPLAGRFGRWALRRGRLAPALGALQLARRPGSQRLFVLLAVAVALLCYAGAALDVAARARGERAEVRQGAQRVLTVLPVDAGTLLHAVRAADPAGGHAMAVGVLPGGDESEPPAVLVDSAALARVPVWRPEFGAGGAAEIARRLHPAVGAPFVLRGTGAVLTVQSPPQPAGAQLRLTLVLRALAGGPPVRAPAGLLTGGRRDYPVRAAECAGGCRVVAVQAEYTRSDATPTELVVTELREAASGQVVVAPADFAGRWRGGVESPPPPDGPGLRLTVTGLGAQRTAWAVPDDVPDALPALVAGELPQTGELLDLDGDRRPVARIGAATALPRLGAHGVLMDLEYAERRSTGDTRLPAAEVWLTADAPAGLPEALRAQGLTLLGERTAADERELLDRQAPALAIWFHLIAAAFAVVLALGGMVLMATVDRRRQHDDERALRRQGLPARLADRAALWSYLPVVVTAPLAGALAAAAAWWLSGAYLPIFVDRSIELSPPRWPAAPTVALPWALATVTFVAAAAGLRWALRVRD